MRVVHLPAEGHRRQRWANGAGWTRDPFSGGCASGDPVKTWQQQVQRYVDQHGGGSLASLRLLGNDPAGHEISAIGNPAGGGVRVTLGFVSGLGRVFRGPRGRRVSGAVEHTAPLLPGSSGGPIVDGAGRLLGINTNRLGKGFYQAIAADVSLRERVNALGRGEAPSRRRLGVGLAPAHVARQLRRAVGLDERDGLLVREVEEESPAAKAGIAEGDLIVAAAGKPVASADDLFDAIGSVAADAELAVTVVRGTEERTVTISA